jgi:hypothetical protein
MDILTWIRSSGGRGFSPDVQVRVFRGFRH